MSHGWNGLGPVRILDLEGDDGGLPLMEYWYPNNISLVFSFLCFSRILVPKFKTKQNKQYRSKNYQHLSATDYLSADDVSTFVKQVFQHYDEKELTAYMNKRKHVTKHLLPRL